MTDHTTPQYMKTTDPAVLEAMQAAVESEREFFRYVNAVSMTLTGAEENVYHAGGTWRGRGIVGVRTQFVDQLPGKWKKPHGALVEPFKNNPIREEWEAKRHPYMPIPGRRQVEWGDGYMGPGTLFEQDGVAYSGYGFLPRDPAPEGNEVWEEILASEFMAAMEAYNDAIEEDNDNG